MSDDHSDGEDPVDTTEDMEIELNLPRELMGSRITSEYLWAPLGAIVPDETALGQEE